MLSSVVSGVYIALVLLTGLTQAYEALLRKSTHCSGLQLPLYEMSDVCYGSGYSETLDSTATAICRMSNSC